MGKILYLECNSGISGDMTVGALLDLGADRQVLEHALESLGVNGYHLHFGRKVVCGLDAFDFDVHLEEDGHEHVHGGEHEHSHEHVHDGGHEHSHEHVHDGEHEHSHHHPHIHRNLHDIYHIIDHLDSNERVKEMARNMFRIVAEAESKAHGLPIEQVHFHEVGAIDSIVDIISVAVCIDNLGVEDVVVSALSEGHGHVHCQHGVLPVPVPATANIASSYGLELHFTDNDGEMVTPTGAAVAAALRTKDRLPASCRLLKIGMGAGNKVFKQANVLRAMLLETSQDENRTMWVLETNLDDCTGEILGLAMEMLLDAGAADVWYTPIYMKKNRPAYMLSVLCGESSVEAMEEIILTQTTTIGIRRYQVERTILGRNEIQVETGYGPADVKVCTYKGRTFFYPEYESIRRICREQGVDFQTAYHEVRMKAEESRQEK
ncbi:MULTISPECIES: nickel pincer cofactor biosynthesis protein LarC [unclassified Clostridium]|uniref:nickel pincer cofactor biosynthesis protein LarC n=1 Tax=unclassified Clostridium TaxID=2614128 RepID=UPI0011072390|nr:MULTISPECIES: nickel pincer cofactor biosynthesis protein LarC [unclassified Clostridium]